jgi:RpiR family transcriptional regulator, carbohydrate utilization regulator
MDRQQVEARLATLTPSLRRVGQVVVAHPSEVIRWSIQELAAAAEVSDPTVMRFCRALGCDGFMDFKLRFAQGLATSHTFAHLAVQEGDSTADLASKVFDGAIGQLAAIRNGLDLATLEAAIDALQTARKVEFHGLGISGRVAGDAHYKFFRLGVHCIAYTDVETQAIAARTLGPGDVVVAISNSGETQEMLAVQRQARQHGALVIAITAAGSSLDRLADIALHVATQNRQEVHSPLIARIGHLLVFDTLAIGLALRRPVAAVVERPRRRRG